MKALSYEEVKSEMKYIIVHDLDANIRMEDIDDDMSLYDEGLGLDSISVINFIVLIEKKFGIGFEENEISSKLFSNINTLAEFVHAKLQLQGATR
jgi:acyl carrier protein